ALLPLRIEGAGAADHPAEFRLGGTHAHDFLHDQALPEFGSGTECEIFAEHLNGKSCAFPSERNRLRVLEGIGRFFAAPAGAVTEELMVPVDANPSVAALFARHHEPPFPPNILRAIAAVL